jgi:hypothetical protein
MKHAASFGLILTTLASSLGSLALPPPSIHYFEWGTAVEGAAFEPRMMFSVVRTTAQLNTLPLGDGTFAQAKIACDQRESADAIHRCRFEITEDDAPAALQTTVSLAPGERVNLGQIEKKSGAKISVFVVAAGNGAHPFASVPSVSPSTSHAIEVQVVSTAKRATQRAIYTFERRADIHRFIALQGETAQLTFDCEDRAAPSQPDVCSFTIAQAGFAPVASALRLQPGNPMRVEQASADGQTFQTWSFVSHAPKVAQADHQP